MYILWSCHESVSVVFMCILRREETTCITQILRHFCFGSHSSQIVLRVVASVNLFSCVK